MLSRSIRMNAKNQPSKLTKAIGGRRRGRSRRHLWQRRKTVLDFVVVDDELWSLDAPGTKPGYDRGGGWASTSAAIKVIGERKEGARFGGFRNIFHRHLCPVIVGRWRGMNLGKTTRHSRWERALSGEVTKGGAGPTTEAIWAIGSLMSMGQASRTTHRAR
jgi:hypothetical protein